MLIFSFKHVGKGHELSKQSPVSCLNHYHPRGSPNWLRTVAILNYRVETEVKYFIGLLSKSYLKESRKQSPRYCERVFPYIVIYSVILRLYLTIHSSILRSYITYYCLMLPVCSSLSWCSPLVSYHEVFHSRTFSFSLACEQVVHLNGCSTS